MARPMEVHTVKWWSAREPALLPIALAALNARENWGDVLGEARVAGARKIEAQ